jgi:uncharacterized protein YeaO (DUF488 family)
VTTQAVAIATKSVYESAEAGDGLRVLITQYWPRGVAKTAIDEYVRELAPSRLLLHAYRNAELDWPRYRHQYLIEMQRQSARREIHRLAKTARSGRITLMCVCKYEDQCHRTLLRDLILGFDEDPQ